MVHKRKSTLVNRHRRQLQRLCDFQAKELHDHRQAFCARYSDLTQPNQPASEVGMFQVVSGRKWIRDNYSNVFRSEPSDPPVEVEMAEATPDDKTSAFDQLVVSNDGLDISWWSTVFIDFVGSVVGSAGYGAESYEAQAGSRV